MNVVDSSGWLEYFAGARHARMFEPVLEDLDSLIVPAVRALEELEPSASGFPACAA